MRGGALSSRSWIVKFMREVCREFVEGCQFTNLLFSSRVFPIAVEQDPDNSGRHGRYSGEEFGEVTVMQLQNPGVPGRAPVRVPCLDPRERCLARNSARLSDQDGDWTRGMAMNENIPRENEHQVFRGASLAKNKVSIFAKPLRSMGRKPAKLSLGQALQRFDRAQGCNDLCDVTVLVSALVCRFHLDRC